MQPWKPVDTIRDSIFPLFYPNSSAESGEKSAVISSNFTSAPDTMHRYYLQHPFISDRDGEISMQSIDLTKRWPLKSSSGYFADQCQSPC
ncbi:Glucosamine-6-phosphate isomerase [Giardia duodenalis]|uniref:Glucosamine-6-phosphate isomerase n=1 Tax=Giardia intestinalis TaxID=5741 RepID=V6TU83_GIAIN|nr:Glucosamine-6-phosphate isomerase [Giardia intestinalis]